MILVRKSFYCSLQLTSCAEYLIIWNIHCIHRKAEENSGASEEGMISLAGHLGVMGETACRLTLSYFTFSAFFLSLLMNQKVKIISFVRQSRKATLYFIEFWMIFFLPQKPKNVHIPINTHDLTPHIFTFKLGFCSLFITFDLLILDCLCLTAVNFLLLWNTWLMCVGLFYFLWNY